MYIPGYVPTKRKATLGYRQCGNQDPNDKSNNSYSIQNKHTSLFFKMTNFTLFLGSKFPLPNISSSQCSKLTLIVAVCIITKLL